METLSIECLRCGETREVESAAERRTRTGECPRCGYVGWAASAELTELVRQALRERPPGDRRGLAVQREDGSEGHTLVSIADGKRSAHAA